MDLATAYAKCDLCTFSEGWSSTEAADAACTWHVYARHPKVWLDVVGKAKPEVPRPGVLGNRLDQAGNEGFTCPSCGRTSFNPNDRAAGYCGACHDWTGVLKRAAA